MVAMVAEFVHLCVQYTAVKNRPWGLVMHHIPAQCTPEGSCAANPVFVEMKLQIH